jgi:predicted Zn-dependent peptidase
MQSFPEGVAKSVEVLGDMLCNSVYDHYHLEMEKDTIWQELESVNQDSKETLMENVYYNCFREHMMGQPILGDIDNIREITREMVVDFHATNYFGENIVIVGTGKVSHQMLVDLAEQHFSSLPRKTSRPIKGLEINSSIGVFYDAPSWSHKDFYSFLLLQRVFGNY